MAHYPAPIIRPTFNVLDFKTASSNGLVSSINSVPIPSLYSGTDVLGPTSTFIISNPSLDLLVPGVYICQYTATTSLGVIGTGWTLVIPDPIQYTFPYHVGKASTSSTPPLNDYVMVLDQYARTIEIINNSSVSITINYSINRFA